MSSFLRDYEEVTQNNEVPKTFHLYSSLVALSSIVSGKVWLDLGLFKIRPNLYVVLTGTPGVKKTTAMSVAKRLIREMKIVPLAAECLTKEALTMEMGAKTRVVEGLTEGSVPDQFGPLDEKKTKFMYTPMSVLVTELSQFVGSGGSAGHMLDFLTTIYDEETYENKTKGKGTDTLPMPYLTLLACTVPDWITARLKDDVITGGFSRRTIFVYEHATNLRVPRPTVTKEMEDAWVRLVAKGRKLLQVKGEVLWAPGAADYYDNWYVNLKRPEDPLLEGWYNSVHIQMLKIAMLIAASEWEHGPLTIDIPSMEMSMELLRLVEENIPKVFKGVGRNELFAISGKIVEMLDFSPKKKLPLQFVQREMYREVNVDEFAKIMNHLISVGTVIKTTEAHPITKKLVIYIALSCPATTDKNTETLTPPQLTPTVTQLLNLNSMEFGAELRAMVLDDYNTTPETDN
jgi:Protein of unknown function (DUF3987)